MSVVGTISARPMNISRGKVFHVEFESMSECAELITDLALKLSSSFSEDKVTFISMAEGMSGLVWILLPMLNSASDFRIIEKQVNQEIENRLKDKGLKYLSLDDQEVSASSHEEGYVLFEASTLSEIAKSTGKEMRSKRL